MNVLSVLKDRFRPVLDDLVDDSTALLEMIVPAQDPRFGDYQANCAMSLSKRLGREPREIAVEIAKRVEIEDVCDEPEVAGPGFINLRLKDSWLVGQLNEMLRDERLGVPPAKVLRTYVVDFSSPNVAKPMHVGHIRSTVIGDALCRVLRCVGHTVHSDNHLGDWGTQFGMIIYGFRHFADQQAYAKGPVEELGRVYKRVRQIMDLQEAEQTLPELEMRHHQQKAQLELMRRQLPTDDPATRKRDAKALRKAESQLDNTAAELNSKKEQLEKAASDATLSTLVEKHPNINESVLGEVAKLHEGDRENVRLWKEFLPHCRVSIQRIYDRLDVRFDHELGESFYHQRLESVVQSLLDRRIASESEGAICVFLEGFDTPMIVRKKDGAFLYATTDLATIQYRMEAWNPDEILYVVDFRQGEHFKKLFAAARLWEDRSVNLRHISFGTVLGEDGRPFKTRSGDTVGLEGLLDEAERRAYDVVRASDDAKPGGPELTEQERRHIAKVVGIAALKYADLSQNRTSDYVFSYDKMLALTGNTATYMQYSYARAHGIFARGNVDVRELRQSSTRIQLNESAERALALQLVRFAEAIDETLADYRPNHLTNYLFELAKCFSTFFETCHVLRAPSDPLRSSRLLLCDITARVIRRGLELLGIQVVEKM